MKTSKRVASACVLAADKTAIELPGLLSISLGLRRGFAGGDVVLSGVFDDTVAGFFLSLSAPAELRVRAGRKIVSVPVVLVGFETARRRRKTTWRATFGQVGAAKYLM